MAELRTIGVYRGVGIHDFQDQARIDGVVRPEIDAVYEIDDPDELIAWAGDVTRSPEARLWAGDRYFAAAESRAAAHDSRLRRGAHLAALLAGVNSLTWADSTRFCSLLDHCQLAPGVPRPAARPPEHRAALEVAKAADRAADRDARGGIYREWRR